MYCFNDQIKETTYRTVSKDLVHKLQTILLNFGYIAIVYSQISAEGSTVYSLKVRTGMVSRFIKEFDIIEKVPTESIELLFSNEEESQSGMFEDYVAEIVKEDEEDTVYGLTLDTGVYVTNGIVSHNTPLVMYDTVPLRYEERNQPMNLIIIFVRMVSG